MSMRRLPPPVHGQDDRCYRKGCRREECRTAYRNARKRESLLRDRGIGGQVAGPVVADHIRNVIASGKTRLEIAAESGVSDRAIRYILDGQPEVQRAKARALFAVRPHAAALRTSATGSRRRIQALATIGWPVIHTADEADTSRRHVFDILRGLVTEIDRSLAERISAIYKAKSSRPGPSTFARNNAHRNGWHGPLAWDDIDNPDEQPDTTVVPDAELKRDELAALRRAEIELLHTACLTDDDIAARVGVKPSTVHGIRAELRAGVRRDRTKQAAA